MHIPFGEVSVLGDHLCLPVVKIGIIAEKLTLGNIGDALDPDEKSRQQDEKKDENRAECSNFHVVIG